MCIVEYQQLKRLSNMGFFKKVFGSAVEEVKKNLEDSKNEILKNLEDKKNEMLKDLNAKKDEALGELGFKSSKTSETSRSISNDERHKSLGKIVDGVLIISEGVEELDNGSLDDYKLLKKIVFPASLKKLDSEVICDQEKLETVDFSKVTLLKEIPDDFICGETSIKEFFIPQGVTKIGDGFLGRCSAGIKVFVPASVKKLGNIDSRHGENDQEVYLFASNLDISSVEEDIKTLYVLDTCYDDYANQLKDADSEARICKMPREMLHMYDMNKIPGDNIDENNSYEITSEDNPFNSQISTKSNTISSYGKSVGREDFPNIESLKSINIPDGVLTIKDDTFKNCYDLESVTLPESVTTIGESAFYGCHKLKSINIPDSVTSIGRYAFWGCHKLKSINIPEGIRTIERDTFAHCSSLEEITIPESVITIESQAFFNCRSLDSLNIPESVRFIKSSAFSKCESLTSITIPSNIKTIEVGTFNCCKNLESVTILDGVETIRNGAFSKCESLRNVSVPKSVKKIESDAFEDCKNLKKKPKTSWF